MAKIITLIISEGTQRLGVYLEMCLSGRVLLYKIMDSIPTTNLASKHHLQKS